MGKILGQEYHWHVLRNSQEAGEEMKEKVGGGVREEGPCQPLQGVGFYSHWAEGLLEGLGQQKDVI